MARRQTFQQRLVAFAINATDDELSAAMDTLKAFVDARGGRKPRKQRKDAGTSRTDADKANAAQA